MRRESIVVYGASGGMGLSAVQIATALGATVIAVDVKDASSPPRGTSEPPMPSMPPPTDPVEAVHELTRGGAHVSVDALGITETCQY